MYTMTSDASSAATRARKIDERDTPSFSKVTMRVSAERTWESAGHARETVTEAAADSDTGRARRPKSMSDASWLDVIRAAGRIGFFEETSAWSVRDRNDTGNSLAVPGRPVTSATPIT